MSFVSNIFDNPKVFPWFILDLFSWLSYNLLEKFFYELNGLDQRLVILSGVFLKLEEFESFLTDLLLAIKLRKELFGRVAAVETELINVTLDETV